MYRHFITLKTLFNINMQNMSLSIKEAINFIPKDFLWLEINTILDFYMVSRLFKNSKIQLTVKYENNLKNLFDSSMDIK